GGWAPELLNSETASWSATAPTDLRGGPLPDGNPGYFRQVNDQIGVTATSDFILGDMHGAPGKRLFGLQATRVRDASPPTQFSFHLDGVPDESADAIVAVASTGGSA